MSLRFIVQEVNISEVKKPGTKGYQVAEIVHTYNGRNQTQKIMSFANPESFKMVQHLAAGDVIDVDITKNDAGYNQWAKVTKATGVMPSDVPVEAKAPATGGKVVGSNYETREERAARQVLIVRQSCLAQAVALLTSAEQGRAEVVLDDVLSTAQAMTDWVFQKPDLFEQQNDLGTSDTED